MRPTLPLPGAPLSLERRFSTISLRKTSQTTPAETKKVLKRIFSKMDTETLSKFRKTCKWASEVTKPQDKWKMREEELSITIHPVEDTPRLGWLDLARDKNFLLVVHQLERDENGPRSVRIEKKNIENQHFRKIFITRPHHCSGEKVTEAEMTQLVDLLFMTKAYQIEFVGMELFTKDMMRKLAKTVSAEKFILYGKYRDLLDVELLEQDESRLDTKLPHFRSPYYCFWSSTTALRAKRVQ